MQDETLTEKNSETQDGAARTGKKKAVRRAPKTSQMERTVTAVLNTVLELLSEVGYRQLTIGLVSERSGVARSTIYRYWKNVPELAIAASDHLFGPQTPAPDTGNIREDLKTIYHRLAVFLKRSIWGKALPSLIEATHNDPAFAGLLPRLADHRREVTRKRIAKAQLTGEIRADANAEWILDALTGLLYYRLLVTGEDMRESGLLDWAIDSVLSLVECKPAEDPHTPG